MGVEKETPDPRQDDRDDRTRDERREIRTRDRTYNLSARDVDTMREIGKFRTVAAGDLEEFHFRGDAARTAHTLRHLAAQGLLRRQMVKAPDGRSIDVLVLTRVGKRLLESRNFAGNQQDKSEQRFYADLKKPAEIFHDILLYRMYQAEAARIREAGGVIRRVILDYELKKTIYPALARARAVSPEEYRARQEELARDHGLKVVNGRIPLPDLRIEYETRDREIDKVDLELATGHYKRSQLAEKANAGFRIYIAGSDSFRGSAVFDDHELTAGILSL